MAKKKTSISIDHRLHADAERIMATRRFTNFSEYVESLIRDDYERSATLKARITEQAADYKAKTGTR